jgi:hypothetical protein
MARKAISVLPAFETAGGSQWAVYCPACRRWHFHGAEPGHRIAHCHTKTGMGEYILEYAGKLTKEIRKKGGLCQPESF